MYKRSDFNNIMGKSRVKQTEEQKHFLEHCIVELEDGRQGYVFSYEENERGVGSYFCHVCNSTLYGWAVVNQHISGKRHSTAMEKSYHPLENFSRIVEVVPKVEIHPEEPAPPGTQDMVVSKKCIIQSKLDSFKSKPLIGLEYLVELLVDDGEPNYYCLLCDKQGVNNNIIVHLSSQIHYLEYLKKYFSNVYSALMMVPKTSNYKKGYSVTITKIISSIESKHGRLKPRQYLEELFNQGMKFEILDIIENEFHFRETIKDNYIDLVDWSEMEKLKFYDQDDEDFMNTQQFDSNFKSENEINNEHSFNNTGEINGAKLQFCKDEDSHEEDAKDDHVNCPDFIALEESIAEDTHKKIARLHTSSSISKSSCASKGHSCSRSCSKSLASQKRLRSSQDSHYRQHSKSRSPSPSSTRSFNNSSYHRSSTRSQQNDSPVYPHSKRQRSFSKSPSRSSPSHCSKSPTPCDLGKTLQKEVEKIGHFKEDKLPKKYKNEKFKEELATLSKELRKKYKYYKNNPEKHPKYQKEWKLFWKYRYKELKSKGKDPVKHDFTPEWMQFWNLRLKNIEDKEFHLRKKSLKLSLRSEDDLKKESDVKTESEINVTKNEVTVDNNNNTLKKLTVSEIKEEPKAHSVTVGDELLFNKNIDTGHRQTHMALSRPPETRQGLQSFDDDAPRVIVVLRLISALESQIGSLGPKVVDLLSKAISMEKAYRGSSQDILRNEEHCVLFETVKEKLKGMLFAGLMDRNFVNMTNMAVKHIEDLFFCVPKVFKNKKPPYIAPASGPTTSSRTNVTASVTVPGVGTIDPTTIAQKIVNALITKGKIDVTEEELEELVDDLVKALFQ